jgi:DNA polymerase-3 subunit delta
MDELKQIVNDIKNGQINPIYFLMGDEPYYIDKICDFMEENILKEEEKGFNQVVLYGRDVGIDDIVSNAKRYPMMADRQLIIVREAQDLSRTIEQLVGYVNNPQPTTTLVFCYKYKTLDGRKALSKALKKNSVLFHSKKLYENQVSDWIRRFLAGKNYTISFKASQMLVDFLGNDLGKINNELTKLMQLLAVGNEITPELIEENIGISKDYNNFELQAAIANKNEMKAHGIVKYFAQNPKNNPLVLTIGLLFNFFSKLLIYHSLSDKSGKSASDALGLKSTYFLKEYQAAAANYPMKKVSQIISLLREYDLKSKGVGVGVMSHNDVLRELLIKLMR